MVLITKRNRVSRASTKHIVVLSTLGILWLTILVVSSVIDPILIFMKFYTRIENGSLVHQFLQKEMESLHLSAFVFNVTNAERFSRGDDQKLALQEVGPFTYREMRHHEDIVFDIESKTMIYTPKVRLEFVPEQSVGFPEDVNITMPNIAMLGLTSKLSTYMYFVRMSFNMLISQIDSQPMVSTDVRTYLWGYQEPLVTLAHTAMPGLISFDKMGLMDRFYDENIENRLELDISDERKFMILKRNGHRKLRMSETVDPDECAKCNTFENSYEGVGYPPGMTRDTPLRMFKNGLCKIIDLEFSETRNMDYGGDAFVYNLSDNFYQIYKNDTDTGILDMSECFFGIPLAISKPHFLDVHPKIYDRIDGMKPDDNYRSWTIIEPKTGLQLDTQVMLQMNLVIGDVNYNSKAKKFSNLVIPICYFKIVQPDPTEEAMKILRQIYVTGPFFILMTQIIMIALSIVTWSYIISLICKRRILPKKRNKKNPELQCQQKNIEEPLVMSLNCMTKSKRMEK